MTEWRYLTDVMSALYHYLCAQAWEGSTMPDCSEAVIKLYTVIVKFRNTTECSC